MMEIPLYLRDARAEGKGSYIDPFTDRPRPEGTVAGILVKSMTP